MKVKTTMALVMGLIFSVTALNVWSCGCKANEKEQKKARAVQKLSENTPPQQQEQSKEQPAGYHQSY